MELNIDNITAQINRMKKAYANPDIAIPAYHHEIEISKEYNGRQILELIQNADDAKATKLQIKLDRPNHILTIHNNGEPLSFEGIKSIMIPNLSSKVSSSYIGNKGLGFRSVLVWADMVKIETSGMCISFSSEIAKHTAYSIGLDLEQIRKERNLSDETCPFPILAIPNVEKQFTNDGCTFHIIFKEEYTNDIIKQIGDIDEKTLLFLNNINSIVIDNNKELKVTKQQNGIYKADGQEWKIIAKEEELPEHLQDKSKNEKKKYGIKLAIPLGEFCTKYNLYNYLPTQEEIALPYLIHATLDLDSSRNHVNQNSTNEYIINCIAKCISNYIDNCKESSNSDPSWEYYTLMTPNEDAPH